MYLINIDGLCFHFDSIQNFLILFVIYLIHGLFRNVLFDFQALEILYIFVINL